MAACVAHWTAAGGLTPNTAQYNQIFIARPGYPLLLAAPFVAVFGLGHGLAIACWLTAMAAGWVCLLIARAAGLRQTGALAAMVAFFLVPSFFWMQQYLTEGPTMVCTLVVLLGTVCALRGRARLGLTIAAAGYAAGFVVRYSTFSVQAGALAVCVLLPLLFGRPARRGVPYGSARRPDRAAFAGPPERVRETSGNTTGPSRRQGHVRKQSINGGEPDAADPEDFQAFVAARSAHLYRTACLLTGGDTHLAEDLVQETLVRMCLKWGKRRQIGNPSGYAQTTMVNVFISGKRKRSNGERPSALVHDPARAAPAGTDVDLRLTLIDALAGLPEIDRAVLVLRFWEDRSVEDTAAALKLNANTVRSRSFRALGRLRELLGSDYIEFAAR